MASLDTALGEENKGYQMLQRMGWGGKGLGRNEDGVLPSPCRTVTHKQADNQQHVHDPTHDTQK